VKPQGTATGPRSSAAPPPNEPNVSDGDLLEQVLDRDNLIQALSRVKANRGAPGVDGMTVKVLNEYLGTYQPMPVRRVEIPKPGGKGVRLLGIPTVVDRLIQQALSQVLGRLFDPHFSDASYGFRPRRSAHQAVRAARDFVAAGLRWVVDVDLTQFFDRVNHDTLMARVARRVKDKRVLKLIRRYLEAGVMLGGVVVRTEEGTPQGGPLSPLLANILLDDLDKELEQRGHRFVRYADDCNVYVGSRRAGERVKKSMTRYLGDRLSLTVNEAKSAVDRPWKRKFLGFSFQMRPEGPIIRIATEALKRARAKLRQLTWRWKGQSIVQTLGRLNAYARGWTGYFSLAETPSVFERLDEWVRRRLRAIMWQQWKRPKARARNMIRLGAPPPSAWKWAMTGKGAWRMSRSAPLHRTLGTAYWHDQGLVSLAETYRRRHA
jgi:RNA-directed DNA polymerase